MKKTAIILCVLLIVSCSEKKLEEKEIVQVYEPTAEERQEQDERMKDKTKGRVKPVEKKGF
jgi:uncharacterized membrane protein YhiD involved in acid resistance